MDAIGLNLKDLLQTFGSSGNVELITISAARETNEISGINTWQELERVNTNSDIKAIHAITSNLVFSESTSLTINFPIANINLSFAKSNYVLYNKSATLSGSQTIQTCLRINGPDLILCGLSTITTTTNSAFSYIYCVLVFH